MKVFLYDTTLRDGNQDRKISLSLADKLQLEENLDMIESSVDYFKDHSEEVIFDAEHFFDGYKSNPEYALETLKVAKRGEII